MFKIGFAMLFCSMALMVTGEPSARHENWQIRNGKFYEDGKWVYLKIGKPLRDFSDPVAVKQLIDDLDMFKTMGYNCLELNCYWHHFEQNGDGVLDKSPEPLIGLINAIYARGMYPCLSIETYGVGGGQIPSGFWDDHPNAMAINSDGVAVQDTEYGTNNAVPSLFSPEYRQSSREFIKSLARAVDTKKLLYFETTVEPQYIGNMNVCYSTHAKREYENWLSENNIDGPAWPEAFPVPASFRTSEIWNRFRAEFLARWINEDAVAYREVAGENAYVAVDYLETGGPEMPNRNGDSLTFLRNLTCANIIQVNWHWHVARRAPNQIAYDNVYQVMQEKGRDWAVTEHMTFNGSDYSAAIAPAMLRNTIEQSTRFGWEFVSLSNSSDNPFALYNNDWSAKPLIAVVDDNWEAWLKEIQERESQ